MDSITLSADNRPLFIDFDLHTDGDEVFKKELIELMIENLRELIQAQIHAEQHHDHGFFLKAVHKMKATLSIINDKDLMDTVTELSDAVLNLDDHKHARIKRFTSLCEAIIKSLCKELT